MVALTCDVGRFLARQLDYASTLQCSIGYLNQFNQWFMVNCLLWGLILYYAIPDCL
ncbi:hypothetical protein AALB_0985 [Agarivorans albus MKT 106]|uniref:Uncharacterized protein n=1 Tax=Agarivorans albus MKT 106 TaxID=1331007 RepID=R9PHS3_AGAAL|nr:hypothetical protein AALB_0985 [Agarivorans albus MKT 106]